jgi:hypothetical protein
VRRRGERRRISSAGRITTQTKILLQRTIPAEEALEEVVVEQDLAVAPLDRLGIAECACTTASVLPALRGVVQARDQRAECVVL